MKIIIQIIKLLIYFIAGILYLNYTATTNFNVLFTVVKIGLHVLIIIEFLVLIKLIFQNEKSSNLLKNIIVSLFSIVVTLSILEIVFVFIPRSNGECYTYGSLNWFKYYWHPINKYGFRDKEQEKGDSNIFFTGDSFTAGHGLKKINQRYSDIVGNNIKGYNAVNLGKDGLDTDGEYKAMIDYIKSSGNKPSKIVLQYYGNDIEQLAGRSGLTFKILQPYGDISNLCKLFVKGSFLINYLYWLYPHAVSQDYSDFLTKAYDNELIFKKHEEELMKFVNYSKENSVELIVVVFPFMNAIEKSKKIYTDKITNFFKDKNIKVIDVGNLCSHLNPREMIVNSNDAHASIKVQYLVANEIIKYFQRK